MPAGHSNQESSGPSVMGSWNAWLSEKTRCCSSLWKKPGQPKQFLFKTVGREAAVMVPWREVDKGLELTLTTLHICPALLPGSNQHVFTELKSLQEASKSASPELEFSALTKIAV